MEEKTTSRKKFARLAGLIYVLFSLQAPLALLYVPSHIMVEGDPAATTHNILAHEFMFGLSIVSQFTGNILYVLLVLMLYRLLRGVNEYQAKLMVVLVVMQATLVFLFETFHLTSLIIAKGEILKTLQPEQKQNLIMLLLNIHGYGNTTLEIFWGLWLVPFGLLVYKSGFIPRILAWCLLIGALGWVVDCVSFLLFPGANAFFSPYVMVTGAIGEFPIMLWLLIMGVREPRKIS
jgi:hypothetical protein